jgi:hypothetical protein
MNNRSALSVTRQITRKPFRFRTSEKSPCKSFRIRTCKSVSKQTTSTPFGINTYKKQGGRGVLLLTSYPIRVRIPSDYREPKDLSSHPTRMLVLSEHRESKDLSPHPFSRRSCLPIAAPSGASRAAAKLPHTLLGAIIPLHTGQGTRDTGHVFPPRGTP